MNQKIITVPFRVIARNKVTKQSPGYGLLRFARNDTKFMSQTHSINAKAHHNWDIYVKKIIF